MNRTILISKDQIAHLNIDEVILPIDPQQLNNGQIVALRGRVKIRVEGVSGPADIYAQAAPRTFFQHLHQRWPYTAYFMQVCPITLNSPQEEIIDLAMFMAMVLCHVGELTHLETPAGVGLSCNHQQLQNHLNELAFHAAELSRLVEWPATSIAAREALLQKSVASFFNAGKTPRNKSRKRKNK
jgi:hypothetical protein